MRVRIAALIAAVAIAGCSNLRHDEVILLPGKDKKVGSVVVSNSGGEVVLDKAYASAKTKGSTIVAGSSSPEEVGKAFGDTLAAQPPRPASYQIYFETGSDRLTGESSRSIEGILADIAKRPSPEVVVIGHTDTVGRAGIRNDELSRQRAEVVRTMLVKRGIPAASISVEGRGSRELLVPTADNVDEPRNRRVEITVR
ncbi:MAG: OmpA family protein [Nitrosomonadales bacterium]|nr:OmpA family protein [Nitrosomonadales bacterium]